GLQGGEPLPQLLLLLPGRRHVAHEGGDADDRAAVAEEQNTKLDRQPAPAAVAGGNPQAVAAVPGLPAGHHRFVPGPVALLELLRNDDVERLADRFRSGVTEGRLGPRVPEAN